MPLEHSNNCSFLLHQQKCNCYMSENEDLLGSKQPLFHPATRNFPDGLHPLTEQAWSQVHEFVELKKQSLGTQDLADSVDNMYPVLKQGEIRVLELEPGNFEDSLHGRLHVVRVDFEYPEVNNFKRHTNHAISFPDGSPFWYTALSYTWGTGKFDVQFHFGSWSSIQITSSLAMALKHLRSEVESVFLWIDQICINQKDIKDKEQQIPLMGMIYSHATHTVIWLGDKGDDDPQMAFDTLQTVHSRLQLFEGEIQPEDFPRLGFPPSSAQEWAEVKNLFDRPWFQRLWVIQEVVLSLNIYVKCGNSVVPWEDLTRWCITMESSGLRSWLDGTSVSNKIQSGLYTTYELSSFRTSRQTRVARPRLLDSLVPTRYANASVAKDKVYGLLGIAGSPILPRYSDEVSARDVFLEAGLEALPMELFPLLSCVDHEHAVSSSWIPDWTVPRATAALGYSSTSKTYYSASGPHYDPKLKYTPMNYTLEDGNRTLVLPAVQVDSIELLGEPLNQEPFTFTTETCVRGNETWLQWLSLIKDLISYPTGETVWDALWQTFVAGKNGSSIASAPQEYSEIFSLIVDECIGREQHIPGQPYSARRQKGFFTVKSLASRKPKQTLGDMKKAFRAASDKRRFSITKKGYFCLVPRRTHVNDVVVIFEGGWVPFITRKALQDNGKRAFELIGETYVHGIMRGEIFESGPVHFENMKLV